MKLIIIIVILFLIVLWIVGHSNWHLNRNKHNQLPVGILVKDKGDIYLDEAGLKWELQPAIKNKFHQPKEAVAAPNKPYPNIKEDIPFDPNNPNLKFLSSLENGGSYEAIIQADGEYLVTGRLKGTYNYGHPSGLWGSLKHTFLDVLPHFVCGDYK